jgi:hypothetical protein
MKMEKTKWEKTVQSLRGDERRGMVTGNALL